MIKSFVVVHMKLGQAISLLVFALAMVISSHSFAYGLNECNVTEAYYCNLDATNDGAASGSFSVISVDDDPCYPTYSYLCTFSGRNGPRSTGFDCHTSPGNEHTPPLSPSCFVTPTPTPTPTATPTPTPTPQQPPDLSVTSVQFEQVVFNPQITITNGSNFPYVPLVPAPSDNFLAVQGKSASFSPTVVLNNPGGVATSGSYQVQIQDASGAIVSQSQQLAISSLASGVPFTITPDQMSPLAPLKSYIPSTLGANSLKAFVVSTNAAITTKDKTGLVMNVIKTYAPSIGLVRFVPSSPTNAYSAVSDATLGVFIGLSPYLSDVFPVSDKSINLLNAGVIEGNPIANSDVAQVNDIQSLDTRRRILQLNRVVAIVDATYYKALGVAADEVGAYYKMMPHVASVRSDGVTALPHELGHSFGIRYELYDYHATYPLLFNGYNADPTGYLAKATSFTNKRSFMDSATLYSTAVTMPWVDDRSYSILFGYMQNPIVDPDTILVTGILNKADKISNMKTYNLPNGVITEATAGGDLVFNTLDKNGLILGTVSMQSDFTKEILGNENYTGPSSVDVDSIPIAVELPANTNIASIQVVKNGKEISKTSVNSLLLPGIIERLPLDEFKTLGCTKAKDKLTLAQKEKSALLEIASAAQRVLESKHPELAAILLDGLILEIKAVTSNTYVAQDGYALSQSTAVSQIKVIEKAIAINVKPVDHGHSGNCSRKNDDRGKSEDHGKSNIRDRQDDRNSQDYANNFNGRNKSDKDQKNDNRGR